MVCIGEEVFMSRCMTRGVREPFVVCLGDAVFVSRVWPRCGLGAICGGSRRGGVCEQMFDNMCEGSHCVLERRCLSRRDRKAKLD